MKKFKLPVEFIIFVFWAVIIALMILVKIYLL